MLCFPQIQNLNSILIGIYIPNNILGRGGAFVMCIDFKLVHVVLATYSMITVSFSSSQQEIFEFMMVAVITVIFFIQRNIRVFTLFLFIFYIRMCVSAVQAVCAFHSFVVNFICENLLNLYCVEQRFVCIVMLCLN